MKPRTDPSPDLLRLADLQNGVLSGSQTEGLGLGRHSVARLVSAGYWRRLDRGIYYARSDQPSWRALAWAGILIGGDEARIAGAGAGHLHGLLPEPDVVPVLVPHSRGMTSRPPWVFSRERAGVRSTASFGCPPRTGIEDTVLDLCATAGPEQVVNLVTSAVQNRLTTPERLRKATALRRRVAHRQLLQDLLADVQVGAETPLELAYLNDCERPHGLPSGIRQGRSRQGRYRRDVVYDDFGLVVELDGRLGHEGMGRFRDMQRDNAAALAGEASLRYGWCDVKGRPCAVAWEVAVVLTGRGWTGAFRCCPRCAAVSEWM